MTDFATAGRTGSDWRIVDAMLPRDHLLRRIDRLLDLSDLRRMLAPHCSRRGRPSLDPELLIRMVLIGRLYAIPSERRLCEEVRYNLAYRWFCRLAPDAAVPHHSPFSKNRHGRFRDAGVFRSLFEATVRWCITAGLVDAKDAAIDASFVAADASWQRKMGEGDLISEAASLARPVREWLGDEAAVVPGEIGRKRGSPAALSRTDPAAAWSARTARGRFGYALNLLIDTPSRVALDVQASPARFASEVDAGRDMLRRALERFGYRPKRVAADGAYGSATFLAFVRDQGALPHIPVLERSGQTGGRLTRQAFTCDAGRDRYICPVGKELTHKGCDARRRLHSYRARLPDCQGCPLREACTDGPVCTLLRMVDEDARDLVRAEMGKALFKRSVRLRRGVERLFADAKARRSPGRLHLRGLRGAEEEFLIATAVLNLMLLARPAGTARRHRSAPDLPTRAGHMARTSLACLASATPVTACRQPQS